MGCDILDTPDNLNSPPNNGFLCNSSFSFCLIFLLVKMDFGSMNPERLVGVRMINHYGFLTNGLTRPGGQSREDFGSRTTAAERIHPFLTLFVLYWNNLVLSWGPHASYINIDFVSGHTWSEVCLGVSLCESPSKDKLSSGFWFLH